MMNNLYRTGAQALLAILWHSGWPPVATSKKSSNRSTRWLSMKVTNATSAA